MKTVCGKSIFSMRVMEATSHDHQALTRVKRDSPWFNLYSKSNAARASFIFRHGDFHYLLRLKMAENIPCVLSRGI